VDLAREQGAQSFADSRHAFRARQKDVAELAGHCDGVSRRIAKLGACLGKRRIEPVQSLPQRASDLGRADDAGLLDPRDLQVRPADV
jgi:hypothetical protein